MPSTVLRKNKRQARGRAMTLAESIASRMKKAGITYEEFSKAVKEEVEIVRRARRSNGNRH